MSYKLLVIIVIFGIVYMAITGIRMEARIKESQELKNKNEEQTKEIAQLKVQLDELRIIVSKLQGIKPKTIEESNEEFDEEFDIEISKLEALQADNQKLQYQIQTLQEENKKLQKKIQELNKTIDNKDYSKNPFVNPFASNSNLLIDKLVNDQEYVYRKKSLYDRPATKQEILNLSKEYLDSIEYYNKNESFKRQGLFTYTCGTQKNTLCEYMHVGSGTEFVLLPKGTLNNTVVESMLIAKYECKQKEWFRIMGTRPWKSDKSIPFKDHIKNEEEYPAIFITLDDMKSYASKRGFKLPSNIQWEYACRAGSTTKYCYGNDSHSLNDYAWFKSNSWDKNEKYAHKVGQKRPNAFGLYDMHGNVSEWCEDSNGYYTSRGGSISYSEKECASSNDGGSIFSTATYNRGGRLMFQ